MTQSSISPSMLSGFVHGKERLYFTISALVSVLIYGSVLLGAYASDTARPTIIMYAVALVLFSVVTHGYMLGHIRGNAVRVSMRQFPGVHQMIVAHAERLGMDAPDAFVLQSGGILNAFATRFLGRNFVVLNSDLLAAAERQGDAVVSFVVGHEMGHLRRGHLTYRWLLAPSRFIPFLGSAYSRACEYTCDRFGAALAPDGAIGGLLVLAAGRDLAHQVQPDLYASQTESETGFWFVVAEIFASHPHLTRRVATLLPVLPRVPSYSPMQQFDASGATVG